MPRIDTLIQGVRGGLVELVRPGEGDLTSRQMVLFGRILLPVAIVLTNLIGAGAVLAISLFVIPMPGRDRRRDHRRPARSSNSHNVTRTVP